MTKRRGLSGSHPHQTVQTRSTTLQRKIPHLGNILRQQRHKTRFTPTYNNKGTPSGNSGAAIETLQHSSGPHKLPQSPSWWSHEDAYERRPGRHDPKNGTLELRHFPYIHKRLTRGVLTQCV